MGLFDRIRGLLGGDSPEGVDRGAGLRRVGTDPDDGRKTGSHGSHWDAVTESGEEVRTAMRAAVDEGAVLEGTTADGRQVRGHEHPPGEAVRTCAVSVGELLTTAYPVGDGVVHPATVEGVIEWANDVEAQLQLSVAGGTLGAFDAGHFRGGEYAAGDDRRVELSAFAYALEPAENETFTTEDGREFSTAGMAGVVPVDGGDVDEFVFQSTAKRVEPLEFLDRTVYRLRLPLFRTADGEDVDVDLYAGDHRVGFRPTEGEDVEGVVWVQARVR